MGLPQIAATQLPAAFFPVLLAFFLSLTYHLLIKTREKGRSCLRTSPWISSISSLGIQIRPNGLSSRRAILTQSKSAVTSRPLQTLPLTLAASALIRFGESRMVRTSLLAPRSTLWRLRQRVIKICRYGFAACFPQMRTMSL